MNLKVCGNCGKINLMNIGKFCDDDCLIVHCEKDKFHLANKFATEKAKERKEKKLK